MDGEYDPTQDDDVASDHIDDDEAGPSKRKTTGTGGGKDDVRRVISLTSDPTRAPSGLLILERNADGTRQDVQHGKERTGPHGTWYKRTKRVESSTLSIHSWPEPGASG